MTTKKLFEQLKGLRKETNIPLIIMGYFNPIMQYGVESFCKDCELAGIDGLIITLNSMNKMPDLKIPGE